MKYLVILTLITWGLKVMLGNIRIFKTGVLSKGLRHLLNIGFSTYLGQNVTDNVLSMMPLEGPVHCPGLAKLKSGPGFCNLSSKAVLAK